MLCPAVFGMSGPGVEGTCVTVRLPVARNNGVVVAPVSVARNQAGLMF